MSTLKKKNDILMLVIVKILVYLVSILYVCVFVCVCVSVYTFIHIFDLAKLSLCYKYSGDYIFKSIYSLNTLL